MSALPSTANRMARVEPSTRVDRAENTGSTAINSNVDEAPLGQLDLTSAITEALERARISHKEAALTMGIDPAQWSRQLHGDGHISVQRLQKLPASFWREFLPLLASPLRLTMSHQDFADLAMLKIVSLVQEIGVYAIQVRAQRRIA
jgi:hypothetical protein